MPHFLVFFGDLNGSSVELKKFNPQSKQVLAFKMDVSNDEDILLPSNADFVTINPYEINANGSAERDGSVIYAVFDIGSSVAYSLERRYGFEQQDLHLIQLGRSSFKNLLGSCEEIFETMSHKPRRFATVYIGG